MVAAIYWCHITPHFSLSYVLTTQEQALPSPSASSLLHHQISLPMDHSHCPMSMLTFLPSYKRQLLIPSSPPAALPLNSLLQQNPQKCYLYHFLCFSSFYSPINSPFLGNHSHPPGTSTMLTAGSHCLWPLSSTQHSCSSSWKHIFHFGFQDSTLGFPPTSQLASFTETPS